MSQRLYWNLLPTKTRVGNIQLRDIIASRFGVVHVLDQSHLLWLEGLIDARVIHCYCEYNIEGIYREEFKDFLCNRCYQARLEALKEKAK